MRITTSLSGSVDLQMLRDAEKVLVNGSQNEEKHAVNRLILAMQGGIEGSAKNREYQVPIELYLLLTEAAETYNRKRNQ